MAMPNQKEELTLHQIMRAADRLPIEELRQLIQHLQFRSWDNIRDLIATEVNENRAAQGLPPATDDEINEEIYARRTPEELEALKHEIQKGIDSADKGEFIPVEDVFRELRERARLRLRTTQK